MTEETELDELRPSRPDGKCVRRNIIDAARALFAEKGYSGAKVEEIVARARTTKPMIYYYFGSKERLFAAVLEDVYAGMRTIEQSLQLAELPALEAMRKVIEVTFGYHAKNPEWVRLVSIANIHYAKHILASETIASKNSAIMELMGSLLRRGIREGVFRKDVDPVHIHLLIISLCFYRVSNRHTWRVIFKRDLESAKDAKLQKKMTVDAVLTYLRKWG